MLAGVTPALVLADVDISDRDSGVASVATTDDLPEGATNKYATDANIGASPDVAANTTARHDAVTLGAGNSSALSLTGQELALSAAALVTEIDAQLGNTDWQTPGSDGNIMSSLIGVNNAAVTHLFNDGSQTWDNLASLTIDQELTIIPGAYGSTNIDTGGFDIDVFGAPGITSNFDLDSGQLLVDIEI